MITMLQTAERLRQGLTTPDDLVACALAAARETEHVFIALLEQRALDAARASTLRWQQGTPLSAFDGIPYAVKDLLDVAGSGRRLAPSRGSTLRSPSRMQQSSPPSPRRA